MKILIDKIDTIVVSFQSENSAESFQLDALSNKLDSIGADWNRWDDRWGGGGITIKCNRKINEN